MVLLDVAAAMEGVSRRKYPKSPDRSGGGVLDVDRGSGSVGAKEAVVVSADTFVARAADRAGYQDLDAQIERTPGMRRASQDRNRAVPRETNQPLGHPRKDRALLEPDAVRNPISARQRRERSKAKHQAQSLLSGAVHAEVEGVLSRPARWTQLNDALSDVAGDAQLLPEAQLRAVQRVDRAIQTYEAGNDRGHVVYANVELPGYVPAGKVVSYLRGAFKPDSRITFDRYTGATHCLHELDTGNPKADARSVVLEIATRRGMYLGRSDRSDDTAHLLPRGMQLRVGSIHQASYTRPDGTRGQRHVMQLVDIDKEQT